MTKGNEMILEIESRSTRLHAVELDLEEAMDLS
jgi:hypothetical protein